MEAIILAGGFGTRLRCVVPDLPKPMALVANRPFLKYIIDDLIEKGITKIILAVGYKKEVIIDYFGCKYKETEILYSLEEDALFTGGAIKLALNLCNNNNVFVVNGDTFFDVDLLSMKYFHRDNRALLTIAAKKMKNSSRYGTIKSKNGRILSFEEKRPVAEGTINGGIYYLNKNLFDGFISNKFSFEQDFMVNNVKELPFFAYESNGYFVDIGIPEDYFRAQKDFGDKYHE